MFIRDTEVSEVRRTPPLDLLDDSPISAPRRCRRAGCTRFRVSASPYCPACGVAATRAWRQRRGKEAGREFSPAAAKERSIRAAIAVYVKRGKLAKGVCEICGESATVASWDDPHRSRETVRWHCRSHYVARRDDRRQNADLRIVLREKYAVVAAELALLPIETRGRIERIAAEHPLARGAQPGSLRYWAALERALRQHQDPEHGAWF